MRKTFALVTIAAAVALAGCGKKDQKVYTDDKGNSVAMSNTGDHMTVTDNKGNTTSMTNSDGHVTITDNNGAKVEYGTGSNVKMPDYLPLYPGATVTTSMTGQGKDGSGGFVVFHAAAQPADIVAFYKQKAGAAGMTDALNMQTGNSMTYMATNDKDKKSLSVTATKAADGTDAQVTWGMK